jgi:DNA processing protein
MEWTEQLQNLQIRSWFYPHKEFFREQWRDPMADRQEIFLRWQNAFPEVLARLQKLINEVPAVRSDTVSDRYPIRSVLFGTDEYPKSFYTMMDPPLILSVMGEAAWMSRPCLSVVGSRKPTRDSLLWIDQELSALVSVDKVTLVSGGAYGIDQAIHALAIRKKIPTIAFLPSGLGQVYPADFLAWAPRIIDSGGCLVSEYPRHQKMEKFCFHHRNRLIAQMGVATLIVQAAERSGTIMTGHLAAEAGKPLWVVPGHPTIPAYRGGLKLLQEGATLVVGADDLSLFLRVETGSLNPYIARLDETSLVIN